MVHHERIVVEDYFIYLFSTLGTCFAASLELFAVFAGTVSCVAWLRDAQGKQDSARANAEAVACRSECGARSSPIVAEEGTSADSPKGL